MELQLLVELALHRRRCIHHENFRNNEVIVLLTERLQQQAHGAGKRVPFGLFADQLLPPPG